MPSTRITQVRPSKWKFASSGARDCSGSLSELTACVRNFGCVGLKGGAQATVYTKEIFSIQTS